jgi:hypothetical protein
MPMDLLLMERQLGDTLASIMRRVAPEAPQNASLLSSLLADGLVRYLIYADRPQDRQEEDVRLMIESLEFWAELHGYPKCAEAVRLGIANRRKPVQKEYGPETRCRTG